MIHQYKLNGYNIVLDICSGGVHVVDDVAYYIISVFEENPKETVLNLTKEQIEASRVLIKRILREHAEKIKRACHSKNWSLDVTRIIAIGGTSKDIEQELKETFGNIIVLPRSNYCNVLGYLRMMCARLPQIERLIPFDKIIESKDKKAKKGTANDSEAA